MESPRVSGRKGAGMGSPRVSGRKGPGVPNGKRFYHQRTRGPAAKVAGATGKKMVVVEDKWDGFGDKWFINKDNIKVTRRGQLWRNIPNGDECNIKIQRSGSGKLKFRPDKKNPPVNHYDNVWVLRDGTLVINQNGAAVNVNVHDTTSSDVDVDSRCP